MIQHTHNVWSAFSNQHRDLNVSVAATGVMQIRTSAMRLYLGNRLSGPAPSGSHTPGLCTGRLSGLAPITGRPGGLLPLRDRLEPTLQRAGTRKPRAVIERFAIAPAAGKASRG
jgi:hypothetical protein